MSMHYARPVDWRPEEHRLFDLCRHLEDVHGYDFGATDGPTWDELYAVEHLHNDLHDRRDTGEYRHTRRDLGRRY